MQSTTARTMGQMRVPVSTCPGPRKTVRLPVASANAGILLFAFERLDVASSSQQVVNTLILDVPMDGHEYRINRKWTAIGARHYSTNDQRRGLEGLANSADNKSRTRQKLVVSLTSSSDVSRLLR
ncbi:hypothetical protein PoB_000994800 [Plakobranchus ocellatus]|uniref:Uncharacterized protein n=1 Tax=Plakobranchus ocellatus TaxID=259542 RepID=A0AAV3YM68_9GAST|nr:hypothetical protein PoB_000994800 [Plakobranchus ocellatus]